MFSSIFVCPFCHGSLLETPLETVIGIKCLRCQMVFEVKQGCVDFSGFDNKGEEKNYYNSIYSLALANNLSYQNFWNKCKQLWFDKNFPSGKDILCNLNDIHNKMILCLGNGLSLKELHFAHMGASLCISDISINAILNMKISNSDYLKEKNVEFHAIDAFHLPFPDSSLDIIYGFAFVHHLSDKTQFLSEVYRVLKYGGKCLFFDDAFSPVWNISKKSILRPLMKYVHKRRGISPEDLRATMEGGFKEKEIIEWGKSVGFNGNPIFIRRMLLSYLFQRLIEKIFPTFLNSPSVDSITHRLVKTDDILSKISNIYQKNLIRVLWGYSKSPPLV